MTPVKRRVPDETWRLLESISIGQAAFLMLGYEPHQLLDRLLTYKDFERPIKIVNRVELIYHALRLGEIEGEIRFHSRQVDEEEWEVDESSPNPIACMVKTASLAAWLINKNIETAFDFGPSPNNFRDQSNPRFAPKLAAAVAAWENFSEVEKRPGSVKQRLEEWLETHAEEFHLLNEEGKPMLNTIEEIAKIVNWVPQGGSPKSRDRKPTKST